jgi:choline monooxygenase
MFVHHVKLPHALPPRLYSDLEHYHRELDKLFWPSWQCIGSTADAPHSGDFFTLERFGRPLLVRNEDGAYHTFLNVCPHRHAIMTNCARGHSDRIVCQYHGWEFGIDGKSARIPDAQSFRPMPGGPECLIKFPTEVRGPLIFATHSDSIPSDPTRSLTDQLGAMTSPCDEFSKDRWHRAETWSYDFAANWKVVAENTVESYHAASVHPASLIFATSEEQAEHEIHAEGTIMRANLVAPPIYKLLAKFVLPRLEPGSSHRYRLFHAFPGLFLIRIDAMLQVMCLCPTSPNTSHLRVDVFVLKAQRETMLSRLLTRLWGRLKCRTIKKVLAEDAALYPAIHRGMQASPFEGTISTREELVYAFQQYIIDGCELSAEARPLNKS